MVPTTGKHTRLITNRKYSTNKWINLFVYVSVVFLIIYLWKNSLFKLPEIVSYLNLSLSLFFLILGNLLLGYSWFITLKSANYNVTLKNSYISTGYSVFGKYIPGKIWLIIGRAGYINKAHGYNFKMLSGYSIYSQTLSILAGLLLGVIPFVMYGFSFHKIWLLIALLFFCSLIFSKYFISSFENLLKKVIKNDTSLPHIPLKKVLRITPIFIFDWFFRGVGFYFLIKSVFPEGADYIMIFFFPMAGVIGILAVFAPGGIGVREGILITLLITTDLTLNEATTVAIFSRLWLLVGELFLFILAVILKFFMPKFNYKYKAPCFPD